MVKQEEPQGPYVFIQWKGTNVCADIHCSCGSQFHIDGDFMYAIECVDCSRKYEIGWYVKMYPVDKIEGCYYKGKTSADDYIGDEITFHTA